MLPADSKQTAIYTITEITSNLKNLIERNFSNIWLKGEISNFKAYHSGHFYFTLKDQNAQISAVMFKGYNRQLKFQLEDGMAVICHGRLTIYESRGQYQILIDHIEPDGIGALQMAFEQLKEKLRQQGLFDESRKKKLPFLPQKVGLITSLHGAAIHDMLTVLKRRFENIDILIYPVKVQGQGAKEEIAEAINYFSQNPLCDVLIVGRGGGSLEDLWAFNEEIVARAIADCPVPIISAVGHETDFSISDFVADLRAPTPSAAAELCVPLKSDLEQVLVKQKIKLSSVVKKMISDRKKDLTHLMKRLPTPQYILEQLLQRLDDLNDRLYQSILLKIRDHKIELTELKIKITNPKPYIENLKQKVFGLKKDLYQIFQTRIKEIQHKVSQNTLKLELLNPKNVLKRGFVMIQSDDQKIITRKKNLHQNDEITLIFHDGQARSKILSTDS